MVKPTTGLQNLMSRAAEQIVLQGASLRHAEAALSTGRTAEALVVLEAAVNGQHLNLRELNALVEEKETELLDKADMADQTALLRAYLAHAPELRESAPVKK